jgi:hypothetical protein
MSARLFEASTDFDSGRRSRRSLVTFDKKDTVTCPLPDAERHLSRRRNGPIERELDSEYNQDTEFRREDTKSRLFPQESYRVDVWSNQITRYCSCAHGIRAPQDAQDKDTLFLRARIPHEDLKADASARVVAAMIMSGQSAGPNMTFDRRSSPPHAR